MTPAPRPSQSDDDALRAAMDKVRGVRPHRGGAQPPGESVRDPSDGPGPRHLWDVRGRVAADLARVPTPNATIWPGPLAGLVAGLWAALMSWCVFAGTVLVAWVFAPQGSGSFADVMRSAGGAWIVANGGVVRWQGAQLSLMPLLATLVIVLFQRRAGTWLVSAVDASAWSAMRAPLFFAVVSSASAQALAAATVMNRSLAVPLWRSVLGAALVALMGLGWGLARSLGVTVNAGLRPAVLVVQRFFVGLTLAALLAVLASAVLHRQAFLEVLQAIAGDRTSIVQALLLCALYLPTLVGWVAAVLLGPGFSLGAGTGVSAFGVQIGALPPIPLLALVPEHAWPGAWLVLGLPLLAAVWATRGLGGESPVAVGLLSVTLAAVLGGVLALATAGGIGPGRLSQVGTVGWQVGAACACWLFAGIVFRRIAARLSGRLRGGRGTSPEGAGKLGA